MGRCKRCNKKGLFVFVNKDGLCDFCTSELSGANAMRQIDDVYHKSFALMPQSQKHLVCQTIIDRYSNEERWMNKLAVGLALAFEGAACRKAAIQKLEEVLPAFSEHELPVSTFGLNANGKPMYCFTQWEYISILGSLCEKEYRFDDAIAYYKKLIRIERGTNFGSYKRIAGVLAKIDINEAVKYYESIKDKAACKSEQASFDYYYQDALDKQARGYVYRPRNKKQ